MSTIQTRFAKRADVHIAYQVVGEGQVDLVMVNGWVTNLELMWEDPGWSAFFRRLASFSRLIVFDKRGTGLLEVGEDRVSEIAKEEHVSLANLRPLLVCQTAEHVEASVETG